MSGPARQFYLHDSHWLWTSRLNPEGLCWCVLRRSVNRCLSPRKAGCAFPTGKVTKAKRWTVLAAEVDP